MHRSAADAGRWPPGPDLSGAQAVTTTCAPGVPRRDDLDPARQVGVGGGRAERRLDPGDRPDIESAKARIVEPAPDRQAPSAPAPRAASTRRGSCG